MKRRDFTKRALAGLVTAIAIPATPALTAPPVVDGRMDASEDGDKEVAAVDENVRADSWTKLGFSINEDGTTTAHVPTVNKVKLTPKLVQDVFNLVGPLENQV